MATSILLKFLTLKWYILRTICRIEVGDGSLFCIFHALSFELNLFFDRRFPLKRRNNQQINEVQLQLGLISTWTSDLVKETSLVSPVETKQVRQMDLNWTCFFCSHENGMVRYPIVPISGSLFRTAQFLDLFWSGPLDFFRTRANTIPLRALFGLKRYDIVFVRTGPQNLYSDFLVFNEKISIRK